MTLADHVALSRLKRPLDERARYYSTKQTNKQGEPMNVFLSTLRVVAMFALVWAMIAAAFVL